MKKGIAVLVVALAVNGFASGASVLAAGKIVDPYKPTLEQQLRYAANAGDVAGIRSLLKMGARINASDEEGWTALIWATLADEPEAVQLLLERGADVNAKDKLGRTPIYWAAMEGNAEIMEALLARGADVNAKEKKRGWTPLMRAVVKGQTDAVEMLLTKGADPNAKDRKGNSALSLASMVGHTGLTRTLVARGAVLDPKAAKRLVAVQEQALTAQTVERSTIVQMTNGPGGGEIASRSIQAAEMTLVGPDSIERTATARADQVHRVQGQVVHALNNRPGATGAKVQPADMLQAGEQLLQKAMGASVNGRTSRPHADDLLRQAVVLWDQLRREHPDVANQLLQSAYKPVVGR